MRIDELAAGLEGRLGVDRITALMAYEEARYLGAPRFALHLCNHVSIRLVIRLWMDDSAALEAVIFTLDKNADTPLETLGTDKLRIERRGENLLVHVPIKSVEGAARTIHRITGLSKETLRTCGYEALWKED